ncbi:GNAT family N-acetyltransferase [Thiolapillus brandeum]|uniref:Acetyltransferase n=1 Tax=Thiolapillus brandeum TaxID=1076588 RepID=A0A7U6GIH3_9GAMM|nr:GNAT family N-acetyltransferase [Thiolapillus brandeum]BAO44225.1 acetyltransferase [Thiolapillus brandeum]
MTEILVADYSRSSHQQAILLLLDAYARDPMGGGEGLDEDVKSTLLPLLATEPGAFSILAFVDERPAGLVNCFQALSTFRAKPLINIHDVAVLPEYRGQGLSTAMLKKVEEIASARGCCKLTLEVLEGNRIARRAYEKFGFSGYELDPALGQALFWEKKLS